MRTNLIENQPELFLQKFWNAEWFSKLEIIIFENLTGFLKQT
jgi:hypothetical protein